MINLNFLIESDIVSFKKCSFLIEIKQKISECWFEGRNPDGWENFENFYLKSNIFTEFPTIFPLSPVWGGEPMLLLYIFPISGVGWRETYTRFLPGYSTAFLYWNPKIIKGFCLLKEEINHMLLRKKLPIWKNRVKEKISNLGKKNE